MHPKLSLLNLLLDGLLWMLRKARALRRNNRP
jgi:hypothetical protein